MSDRAGLDIEWRSRHERLVAELALGIWQAQAELHTQGRIQEIQDTLLYTILHYYRDSPRQTLRAGSALEEWNAVLMLFGIRCMEIGYARGLAARHTEGEQ